MSEKHGEILVHAVAISVILLAVAFIYGWLANLVKIFATSDTGSVEFVIRIVGVPIAVIGAIIGYL